MKKKLFVLLVALAFALLFRSMAKTMDQSKLARVQKNANDIDLVRVEDCKGTREYTETEDISALVKRYLYGGKAKISSTITEKGTISFYMGAHLVTKGKIYEDAANHRFVRIERVLLSVLDEEGS